MTEGHRLRLYENEHMKEEKGRKFGPHIELHIQFECFAENNCNGIVLGNNGRT
jgi:hypothetical protein